MSWETTTYTPSKLLLSNTEELLNLDGFVSNYFDGRPCLTVEFSFKVTLTALQTIPNLTVLTKRLWVQATKQEIISMILEGEDFLVAGEWYETNTYSVYIYAYATADIDPVIAHLKRGKKKHSGPKPGDSRVRLLINVPGKGMTLKDCELKCPVVVIDKHYNNDIIPFIDAVSAALSDGESSGLILMDGVSGSGKTSLVKHLTKEFSDRNFLYVPSGSVESLASPDLLNILLENPGTVLFIEDAERCLASREHGGNTSVVSTLMQLTDGVLGDALKLMVIATCNTDLRNVDQALLRAGRLIGQYTFGKLSGSKADRIRQELGKQQTMLDDTLANLYADAPVVSEKATSNRVSMVLSNLNKPAPING